MTAFVTAQDKTDSFPKAIGVLTAVTVYACESEGGAKGVSMNLCNVDGTAAVEVTVSWYRDRDGLVTRLLSTYSVAADSRFLLDLGGMWFDVNDELRVTASAINDLEVVTTVIQTES